MVRQAVIGDPNTLTWADSSRVLGTPSHDGEHVAIVVTRGNVQQGTNDADLLLYRTSELLERPAPRIVATRASATQYQPLALVRWLSDDRTLVFAGSEGQGFPQVYSVDVRVPKLTTLTSVHAPLQWYDITPSGEWLVTATQPPEAPPAENPECLQRGCLVTAETLYAAEHGVPETAAVLTIHNLRTGKARAIAPAEENDRNLFACRDELAGGLSPNGRFGLRTCRLKPQGWPAWWADYDVNPAWREALSKGKNGHFRQWVLFDFERGTSARLTDAPFPVVNMPRASPPLWIEGGRRLILVGALESLAGTSGEERARRSSRYAVVRIDPSTRRAERITAFDTNVKRITATSWHESTQTLTIESQDSDRKALPPFAYRRTPAGWAGVAASATLPTASSTLPGGLRLAIEQSLNHPPVLMAIDANTGLRKRVLDPNPWLAERRLGRVQAIAWKARDGREWRGGLYYPPDYVEGSRYPLMLQTHGFDPDKFSLYGIARNFAAQPLAACGIVVLQVDENISGASGLAEWPAVQAGYEGAIDHLDELGVIDRTRVGIQGWSRSGPYTGHTLVRSSYPFAAAALTESGDFGWWWYLLMGAQHAESEYETPPFGAGLDVWRRMSPSFNLDRIHTPMLMWGTGSVAGLWDWYVGLRRLGKPVEHWYLPDGTHDVFKVGERLRTNQLLVDWFRFWLKDEEDPAVVKAGQYARWRKLREQQQTAGPAGPQLSHAADSSIQSSQ